MSGEDLEDSGPVKASGKGEEEEEEERKEEEAEKWNLKVGLKMKLQQRGALDHAKRLRY